MGGKAMNVTTEVIEGTLKPDGTLELDEKPSLGPGRVKVALQPAQAGAPGPGLAEVLDEIHRGQHARGFQGRSPDEIETGLREGEDDYEAKAQSLRSQTKPLPPAPRV
jgi:hypothetical protein